MDSIYGNFDPLAALRNAQREQLSAMIEMRTNEANTVLANSRNRGGQSLPAPTGPVDTVQFGSTRPDLGLMPNPLSLGNSTHEIPSPDDPLYFQKQNAYYDDVLRQILMLKAMEAAAGLDEKKDTKNAQKGDLNVVAGNRSDGVKAKTVTVHEKRNWSSREHDYNPAGFNSHESTFSDKKVGSTYQVRVEWEDGTSTVRDVTMDSPGQTVYIDGAY